MIDVNVATKLTCPLWMNNDGDLVREEDSTGFKVTARLAHPRCCIVLDEVRGDISMLVDSTGSTKYVTRDGDSAIQKA